MSLETLLEAAKVVEQRENAGKYTIGNRKDRKFAKRSQTYRATHNQLEKNRRAHLRDCLVSLRDLVPNSPDTSKVTTLSLLQSAKQYIKVLENHDRESQSIKRTLCLEQQHLRKKLAALMNGFDITSDSSILSPETSISSIEEELIDVENDDETGYGSADDRNSTSSSSSSLNSVL
ncbi:max dimerization protein 1-like [Hydra vulgaris]|uniref:Max dimerization protein 1-like n=1 Tax=Hydra vulgaris TaxID=6087 RepID=A0ABM4BVS8_HYDVU